MDKSNLSKSVFILFLLMLGCFFVTNAVMAASEPSEESSSESPVVYVLLFGASDVPGTISLDGVGRDIFRFHPDGITPSESSEGEYTDESKVKLTDKSENICVLYDRQYVDLQDEDRQDENLQDEDLQDEVQVIVPRRNPKDPDKNSFFGFWDEPSKNNFFDSLDEINQKMNPQDTLYVIVATHGVLYKGWSFFTPKDAKWDEFKAELMKNKDEQDFEKLDFEKLCDDHNIISVQELYDCLTENKGNIIVILDVCRLNLGSNEEGNKNGNGKADQREKLSEEKPILLMESCGWDEEAEDKFSFLSYFAEGLNGDADCYYGDLNGKVSPFEAYNYAAARIRGKYPQNPQFRSHMTKEQSNIMKNIVIAESVASKADGKTYQERVWDDCFNLLRGVDDNSQDNAINEAIDKLKKLLEERPTFDKARKLRGVAYRMLGDYSKALEDFKEGDEDMVLFAQKKETYAYVNSKDSALVRDSSRRPNGFIAPDVLLIDNVDETANRLHVSHMNGIKLAGDEFWVKKSDVGWLKEQANSVYEGEGGRLTRTGVEYPAVAGATNFSGDSGQVVPIFN